MCEKHYISVCVEGSAHKMAIPYCVLDVSLRAGWLPVSVSADCVLCDGSSEESSVTVAAGWKGRQDKHWVCTGQGLDHTRLCKGLPIGWKLYSL